MLKIRVVKAMLRATAAAVISLFIAFSAVAQTVRYVHTDGLGSVVLTTDKDRNIVERSEYEPYGSLLNRTLTDGPGYTGHVMDAATGLTYMQQRYYDQSLGRFLSIDPIRTNATNGSGFNRYWYGNNNPYKFTDPDGRQSMGSPRDFYNPVTEEQSRQFAPIIADFTPVVGDIKGFVDAYNNPTAANISSAVIGLAGPVGDAAGKVIKGADKAASIGKLFHYTDEAGAAAIKESGKILPDARGRVFLTTDAVPPAEASNALFMGLGGTKGTHVVEVDMHSADRLRDGTQANEIIHDGTIRNGRQAELIIRENDFK